MGALEALALGFVGIQPGKQKRHSDNVGHGELNSGNIYKGGVREVKQKVWRQPRDREQWEATTIQGL